MCCSQCGPCLQQGRQHALQPHCAARRGREAGPAENIDDASTSGVDDIDIDHASNGAIALDGGSMAKVCVFFPAPGTTPARICQAYCQTFLSKAGVVGLHFNPCKVVIRGERSGLGCTIELTL